MTRHVHADPGARRVIFWRHGRTEWNHAGRFQGQEDIDLDATGREQALRAAEVLETRHPSSIISSDLRRAADTAAALADLTGLLVSYDERLRAVLHALTSGFHADTVNVVCAHAFAAGGTMGGGERSVHTIEDYSLMEVVPQPEGCCR